MKNLYINRGALFLTLFFTFLAFNGFAQVGIGTTNPQTGLDVNGGLSLREGPALNFNSNPGNLDNVDLGTTPYSFYRITGSNNDFELRSIIPEPDADGQILTLINTRNAAMTIKHNTGGSSANRRIYVPGENDLQLRGRYTAITLQYSMELERWILLNKLNHIETHRDTKTIANGSNLYTTSIAGATTSSSVNVNFSGNISNPDNLFIEYIESRNGSVAYRIRNSGSSVNNVGIVISINKI
ncbi:hypothetical protein [Aequorivita marina]|uniref:hypothetical protein n=1 Tax=Aequorivita marina TaxID=3073654 RepID=UPI002875774C|nr:hypothetical protein [Aequorivita sp. S2608]MDS1298069.1 hypothetical protein [Aequorivita sp. S2608]